MQNSSTHILLYVADSQHRLVNFSFPELKLRLVRMMLRMLEKTAASLLSGYNIF